jgi:drug/metabolite transporter (DMT)-like permease
MTVVLALASALCFAVADLCNARISRRAPLLSALPWVLLVGLVVAAPVALLVDRPLGDGGWSAAAAASLGGITNLIGLMALLAALRRGNLSVIAPLTALEGGIGALIALVGGERITSAALVGLALAVVGGVLTATERGRRTAAGAGWALAAAGCFGVTFNLYGAAGALSAFGVVAAARLTGLAIAIPAALGGAGLRLPSHVRPLVLASGLLETVGFIMVAAALALGPVSVASVLTAQFATFAVLLGILFLNERPARHQLVGIVVTLVAVSMLAATS